MKKIISILILLLAFSFGYGQTTLSAGDIAITGFNSDDPDEFSFVLLTDVTNTTVIKFTDNGWFSAGGFRATEGILEWTATSDLPCGTEITIRDDSPFSASIGSVTDDNSFLLAATGDQILAYQGTEASPTFIYGIHFHGTTGWSTDATSAQTSAIPTGLTNGTNAIAINHIDNAVYDCSTSSDSALILTEVSDSSNWSGDNNFRQNLGACYYSCVSCSGGVTIWDGTNWSAGVPDITTQAVIAGNYDTSVGGVQDSFSACSLDVDATFTLNVADGNFIRVQNDITVNGSMTVQPEGAVVQVDDNSNVIENGSVTVIKTTSQLNAWYEYTYWSSPVSGETIGNGLFESQITRRFVYNAQNYLDATQETNNNDATLPGQDDIDDNGNDWIWVDGTATMQAGVGYAATHRESLFVGPPFSSPPYQFDYTFEGPFNNGIINVPVYRNDSELNDSNWNLIGNPYPSAIDADLFLAANSDIDASVTTATGSTIDGAIFIWSQNTAPSETANGNEGLNFADADYAIINGVGETTGGDGTTPFIISSGIRAIPSGQAFFVSYSDAATPVSTSVNGDGHTIAEGNVIFNNSMRVFGVDDNTKFFKNGSSKNKSNSFNKLWVDLTSNNGVFNQTLIGYMDNATNNYDGMYFDAVKNLSSNTSAALYSLIDGVDKKFAIQGKASNSLDTDEIVQLGFKTSIDVATIYTLSIAQLQGDFLSNNTVYLKDNLTNTVHNLSDGDYSFTSEVGEFNERFEVAFSAVALSNDEFTLNANDIKIVQLDDNNIQFTTETSTFKSIVIFDLLGRSLYHLDGKNNNETYNLSTLKNSVYIANIELENGATVSKKFIKR